MFNEAVVKELGNYVYRLFDPRNGETFYVGKGQGNRVFEHVNASIKFDGDEDQASTKIARINEIRWQGLNVLHVIHRHGIPDASIFEVEAALIDAYPGLENIAGGHGSADRGPMHAQQIIDKYDLPTIDAEPEHSLVLIKFNRFGGADKDDIYRQTRMAWRISRARAERAEFVLSVVRGVVIGAFEATKWLPATRANFRELSEDMPSRSGFIGKPAPDDIWDLYAGERGKRIEVDALKHIQNPVRYWQV